MAADGTVAGRCHAVRPYGDDSLFDLASQVELSQCARSQLTQSGLCVLGARLVGLDGDADLVADAPRLESQLAARSLKPLSRHALPNHSYEVQWIEVSADGGVFGVGAGEGEHH